MSCCGRPRRPHWHRPTCRPPSPCPPAEDGESSDGGGGKAGDESEDEAEWMKRLIAGKLSKGDKLLGAAVDHSAVEYPPFRWGACCVGCLGARGWE